ncbi:hypothetical protein DERP_006773, partial [Dermatophagoides pteronyssinus]
YITLFFSITQNECCVYSFIQLLHFNAFIYNTLFGMGKCNKIKVSHVMQNDIILNEMQKKKNSIQNKYEIQMEVIYSNKNYFLDFLRASELQLQI